MGRLEIDIRHGHDHGGGPAQWGAVVALTLFVLLAAAGHREIGAVMHEVLTIAEIAAYSAAGIAVLVVTAVVVARTRSARRSRARRGPVPLARPEYRVYVTPADDERPALHMSRRRAAGWPLADQWDEITPGDSDNRRGLS
jgi:hypothetical protein